MVLIFFILYPFNSFYHFFFYLFGFKATESLNFVLSLIFLCYKLEKLLFIKIHELNLATNENHYKYLLINIGKISFFLMLIIIAVFNDNEVIKSNISYHFVLH